MNLTVKHLDAELIAYINESKNIFERRAKMIAVKLHVTGAIQRDELDYGTVLAKRTIGEYNRTKGNVDGTYTEEMYVYGTPFKTAFIYITENRNHFFTYFKYLIDMHGEENVEIHRMSENYSADSVVALLKLDHQDVHNVQYVTYHSINDKCIRTRFSSKKALSKHFKLKEEALQKALVTKQFEYEGQLVFLKIIPASVEVDFLKDKERTENLIQSFERAKAKELNKKEQRALAKQIATLHQELKLIDVLIEADKQHNQRVLNLKGSNVSEIWKQVVNQLKGEYQTQKETIAKMLDAYLIDLFETDTIIELKKFHAITDDSFRIKSIIDELKEYECEIKGSTVVIKSKEYVS